MKLLQFFSAAQAPLTSRGGPYEGIHPLKLPGWDVPSQTLPVGDADAIVEKDSVDTADEEDGAEMGETAAAFFEDELEIVGDADDPIIKASLIEELDAIIEDRAVVSRGLKRHVQGRPPIL